jgi:peptidoglycan/xylan/chitin deacetylase (PgdA/CDA1 family)
MMQSMSRLMFTTSWDDGHALDKRIADLLDTYSLKGTFYVLPPKVQKNPLSDEDIRSLGERHEIGAHTMSHRNVSTLSQEELRREINGSKEWIEGVTGKPCTMFCYPRGDVTHEAQKLIEETGFMGARTTELLRTNLDSTFHIPTTLQVYPFPWRPRFSSWWHPLDPLGPMRAKMRRIIQLKLPFRSLKNWNSFAEALLDNSIQNEEMFFHLWGHAHEIERYNMWDQLEDFLAYAQKQNIQPVTNSELVTSSPRISS